MDILIRPRLLSGSVVPPPSKSVSHRLIICAALAEGESLIRRLAFSEDVLATLGCMETLGASWTRVAEDEILIRGLGGRTPLTSLPQFDCGESGSTLRFLIPLALALAGGGEFRGRGRLMERPQQPYFVLFDRQGVKYEQTDGVLRVQGRLSPGVFDLPGEVSSQFISGLLFALPLLSGDSSIRLLSPLQSASYVNLTIEAQARHGVQSQMALSEPPQYHVPGGQRYLPQSGSVEADWSQAGFFYAARGLGSDLRISGLSDTSAQGDRVVAAQMEALSHEGSVTLDVGDCPDLVPPLAARAALRQGDTHIVNAARLRIKESDRLQSVRSVLSAMGADIEEQPDGLIIHGREELRGSCEIDCCNDHRIAMMAAMAATRCRGEVRLLGADCVKKSYPDFWDVYRSLGGDFDVLDLR